METISVNLDEIQDKIASWKRVDYAASRSINDAMAKAKTAASKHTRSKYTLKAKAIRRYENVSKASPSNLIAKITYRGDMTNLINYSIRPAKPMNGKVGTRLKAAVKKGSSKAYHPSFVVSGGKVKVAGGLVMRRWGDDNKIAPVYGPSISMLMNNDDSKKAFTDVASDTYERRIVYWMDRELK